MTFESSASNLVEGDGNNRSDVFVRDVRKGITSLVSVSSAGTQGDGGSFVPRISGNGRIIVFQSSATNLVTNDTNGAGDTFARDLKSGTTTRESVSSSTAQGNLGAASCAVSADGRYVAFGSNSTDLIPDDTNSRADVFIHDRRP